MKKYLFASIALIAALAASCTKEETMNSGLKFTVSAETVKTTLEAGDKVCWQPDDRISICGIVYKIGEIRQDASCALFVKENPGDPDPEPFDGKYRAVYPCTLGFDSAMQLPREQTYNAPNSLAAVSPMYAESETTDLMFTNICGILELAVKGAGTVTRIEVKDAEKCLWGSCTLNDGAAGVAYDAEEEIKEHLDGIVLGCGDGVGLSEDEDAVFRVALPVGEYSNLSFVFYNDSNVPCEFCLKPEASATIAKNTIYPIHVTVAFSNAGQEVGNFSVGEGRQVVFSSGNLSIVDEMPLIENYVYAGDNLYGRGTYRFNWENWGKYYEENTGEEGWRLLSSAEWKYLLEERQTSGGPRYLNATGTPVVVSGVKCYGLLIFPDDYSGDAATETYTWAKMQRLGIVFLPASGCDYLSGGDGVAKYGRYWASDAIEGTPLAFNVSFGPNGVVAYNAFSKESEYSVRFVRDVE